LLLSLRVQIHPKLTSYFLGVLHVELWVYFLPVLQSLWVLETRNILLFFLFEFNFLIFNE
jgi:hypothetical protein